MFFCFPSSKLHFGIDVTEGKEDRLLAQPFRTFVILRRLVFLSLNFLTYKLKKRNTLVILAPWQGYCRAQSDTYFKLAVSSSFSKGLDHFKMVWRNFFLRLVASPHLLWCSFYYCPLKWQIQVYLAVLYISVYFWFGVCFSNWRWGRGRNRSNIAIIRIRKCTNLF